MDSQGKIVTIERFILENQPDYARGTFTNLLYDIALAAKMIARKTTRAGLSNILGRAGSENVHGETQQKLDVYADDIIFRLCDHTGRLCAMASEEHEEFLRIPDKYTIHWTAPAISTSTSASAPFSAFTAPSITIGGVALRISCSLAAGWSPPATCFTAPAP